MVKKKRTISLLLMICMLLASISYNGIYAETHNQNDKELSANVKDYKIPQEMIPKNKMSSNPVVPDNYYLDDIENSQVKKEDDIKNDKFKIDVEEKYNIASFPKIESADSVEIAEKLIDKTISYAKEISAIQSKSEMWLKATITFRNFLSYEEIDTFVNKYNIKTHYSEFKGCIDNSVSICNVGLEDMSKVYDDNKNNYIEFGYTALFGYVLASEVDKLILDDTLLLDITGDKIFTKKTDDRYNSPLSKKLKLKTYDASLKFDNKIFQDKSITKDTKISQAIDNENNFLVNNTILSTSVENYNVQSPHPYPSNYNNTWQISKSGASRIRVHFTYISVETNHDYVTTSAGDIFTGDRYDIWSNWSSGSAISVTLIADNVLEANGFVIDKIEYEMPTSSLNSRAYYVRSPHGYWNDFDHTWTIKKIGSNKFRVRFKQISTEKTYDKVTTSVGDTWSGNYTNVWSSWCYGDTMTVRFKADGSVEGWGFEIDLIEYEGDITLNNPQTYSDNYKFESDHPYENNYWYWYWVGYDNPDIKKMRVHFSYIDLENACDILTTSAGDYLTGSRTDFWSNWTDGDKLYMEMDTDGSVTKKGFVIDRMEYIIDTDDDYGNEFWNAEVVTLNSQGSLTKNGEVDYPGDMDMFKFRAPAGGSYTFETKGSTDTMGLLFNANQSAMNDERNHDDSGDDWNFKTTATLNANAEYYIRVRGYTRTDGTSSVTGPYTLVITGLGSDSTPPTCDSVTSSASPTSSSYFKAYANNVTDASGVAKVAFAVWTHNNGQDDLNPNWANDCLGTYDSTFDRWEYRVDISQHSNETGEYVICAYGYDTLGNFGMLGSANVTVLSQPNNQQVLNVTPVRQRDPNWCWAASCEMLGDWFYNGSSSKRTQEDIVRFYTGGELISTGVAPPSAIIYPAKFATYDTASFQFNGIWSFAQIKAEIDSNEIVKVGITGHAMVLNGYSEDGEMLSIIDPWDGVPKWVNYTDFCTGSATFFNRKYEDTVYKVN